MRFNVVSGWRPTPSGWVRSRTLACTECKCAVGVSLDGSSAVEYTCGCGKTVHDGAVDVDAISVARAVDNARPPPPVLCILSYGTRSVRCGSCEACLLWAVAEAVHRQALADGACPLCGSIRPHSPECELRHLIDATSL